MIEPRAVAIMHVGFSALEGAEPADHKLLSELVADLDTDGLCRVIETLTIAVVDLLTRLHEERPGFEPEDWIQRFGLIAAGAR